jgi:hypothetical protein
MLPLGFKSLTGCVPVPYNYLMKSVICLCAKLNLIYVIVVSVIVEVTRGLKDGLAHLCGSFLIIFLYVHCSSEHKTRLYTIQ